MVEMATDHAVGALEGMVQTVLGPVDPGLLGVTSSHEHILSDMSAYFQEPEKPSDHVENFDYTLETRLRILETGCYVGYDSFGNLGYPHSYLGRVINLTTDFHRIRDIMDLMKRGYLAQILVGQDLCSGVRDRPRIAAGLTATRHVLYLQSGQGPAGGSQARRGNVINKEAP